MTESSHLKKLCAGSPLRIAVALFIFSLVMVFSAPAEAGRGKAKKRDLGPAAPLWPALNKWDEQAEKEYSEFVAHLGKARADRVCLRLNSCLLNPKANKLWSPEDRVLKVYADCADLPYVLRAYFAYKTRRPFQWTRVIKGRRYSKRNKPRDFLDYTNPSVASMKKLLGRVNRCVQSGFYRMDGQLEDTDTYPVDVNRKTVRPGTIYYDPRGHVLTVYSVEENGTVRMIAGHPDNSLTHTSLSPKFTIGRKHNGGGFRNWRRYKMDEPTPGEYLFTRESNQEILERKGGIDGDAQYHKKYNVDGYVVTYFDWVRSRLSASGLRIQPLPEFDELVRSLCNDVQERVAAVQIAQDDKIHLKPHPGKLPRNIYGTSGEWEVYSSPSRDARLKASVRHLHGWIQDVVKWASRNNSRLDYDGNGFDLIGEIQQRWQMHAGSEACQFTYLNSKNAQVALSLYDVMDRLFDLSFDPYHCPELRWGAKRGSDEYRSCKRDSGKSWIYYSERRLRNQIEREYGVKTGFRFGPKRKPEIHISALLETVRRSLAETQGLHSGQGTRAELELKEKREDIEE